MIIPKRIRFLSALQFFVVSLAAAPPCLPDGSFQLYTVTPCRIVDTRGSYGPTGGPALNGGVIRAFPARNYCQIPMTARGVSLNITVVAPTAAGHFAIWTYNTAQPETSNINLSGGEVAIANGALVLVAGDLQFDVSTIYQAGPSEAAHLVIDVNGYLQ